MNGPVITEKLYDARTSELNHRVEDALTTANTEVKVVPHPYGTCECGHAYLNHAVEDIPGKQRCKAARCKCKCYQMPAGEAA